MAHISHFLLLVSFIFQIIPHFPCEYDIFSLLLQHKFAIVRKRHHKFIYMPEFINPRVDWAFKRIFGTEDTKECLITFLNGVFEGEFVIKDVKHLKTEQTRHQKRERGVIFDVACETDDGRHIIVEMQKKEQRYFVDRALYYSAKAIVEQAQPGEWDFHLTPVYTVCFMDFIAETGIPCQFRTDIGFGLLEEEGSILDEPTELLGCGSKGQGEQQGCDAKTQARQLRCDAKEQASQLVPRKRRKKKESKAKAWKLSGLRYGFEKMRVVFLQLPLFEKKEPECMDIFDCWIYVLNNMEHLKEIPFLDKYPVFRKLAAIGDLQKLTPEERDYYEEDVKIMRDLYATDKWEKEKRRMAREKALTEGRAEGIAEGRAEGRAEGIAEGMEKGELKGKLAIAQKMLSANLPDAQIMAFTGLTQEQINRLKN